MANNNILITMDYMWLHAGNWLSLRTVFPHKSAKKNKAKNEFSFEICFAIVWKLHNSATSQQTWWALFNISYI